MGNFTDKDMGWERLMARLHTNEKEVEAFVGFLRSSGTHKPKEGSHATPITVAAVARIQEYGSPSRGIPERSYFRSTMAEKERALIQLKKKEVKKWIEGKQTQKQALGVVAQKLVDWVKSKIDSNIPPPNAPSTQAQKGSDQTLIDQGQLRNSVDWEFREGKA